MKGEVVRDREQLNISEACGGVSSNNSQHHSRPRPLSSGRVGSGRWRVAVVRWRFSLPGGARCGLGGRWCAHGRAASICVARFNRIVSLFGGPQSWMLSGRSWASKPAGTDAAGCPRRSTAPPRRRRGRFAAPLGRHAGRGPARRAPSRRGFDGEVIQHRHTARNRVELGRKTVAASPLARARRAWPVAVAVRPTMPLLAEARCAYRSVATTGAVWLRSRSFAVCC